MATSSESRELTVVEPDAVSPVLRQVQTARLQHAYSLPGGQAWVGAEAGRVVLADPTRWAEQGLCPMCVAPVAASADACGQCGAPLLPPLQAAGLRDGQQGRRASPRLPRLDDRAQLLLPGATQSVAVRVHDLSLTGVGLEAPWSVREGSPARLMSGAFDAVIQILHSRRDEGHHRLHGRWLTMRLLQRAGAFVSTRA
jgi:hypothetical protein